jgi:hypothetical protein
MIRNSREEENAALITCSSAVGSGFVSEITGRKEVPSEDELL